MYSQVVNRIPKHVPRIDWKNPITEGLRFLLLGPYLVNLVDGKYAYLAFGTNGQYAMRPEGITITSSPFGNQRQVLRDNGPVLGPLQNSTALAVARTNINTVINTGGSAGNFDIGISGNSIYSERAATGNDIYKITLISDAASNLFSEFTYRNDAGILLQQRVAAATANDGRFHFFGGRKQGTSHTVYFDFTSATGTFGSGSTAFTNSGLECWLQCDKGDSSAQWGGTIPILAGWSRDLSDEEINIFRNNPLCLLEEEDVDLMPIFGTYATISGYRTGSDILTTGWTAVPGPNFYSAIDEDEGSLSNLDRVISSDDNSNPLIMGLNQPLPVGNWTIKIYAKYTEEVRSLRLVLLDEANNPTGTSSWVPINNGIFDLYEIPVTTTAESTRIRLEVQ